MDGGYRAFYAEDEPPAGLPTTDSTFQLRHFVARIGLRTSLPPSQAIEGEAVAKQDGQKQEPGSAELQHGNVVGVSEVVTLRRVIPQMLTAARPNSAPTE